MYDFKRAVEDGATVPLYYENRADKIAQLDKPEITGRILDAIEAADLDPSQEEKLEREFAKEILFSPQMNGCVPLQRTLWSITLTFGPAARRCSSA